MAKLYYKYEDEQEPGWTNIVYPNAFVIHERNLYVQYCEEYDIIKKIQRNEEGFFDFSKNMIERRMVITPCYWISSIIIVLNQIRPRVVY